MLAEPQEIRNERHDSFLESLTLREEEKVALEHRTFLGRQKIIRITKDIYFDNKENFAI